MAISKKTTKPSSSSSATHPPYLQMINEAIASLKDRKGSSQPAIAKFISEKYNPILPPNFTKLLSAQLKRHVKSEKIVKIKNSYKISTKPKKANLVFSTTKESKMKTEVKKAKFVVSVESDGKEKRMKMKRLSQVKTPEALKKNKKSQKMKRLSQVKTPEAMKKNDKKTVYKSTPAPKRLGPKK